MHALDYKQFECDKRHREPLYFFMRTRQNKTTEVIKKMLKLLQKLETRNVCIVNH